MSSVLAVETRRGNENKRVSGAFDMSITDASVVLEGKLPGVERGSWLLSGRRTYYDLIVESAVEGEFPFFSDLQTKWFWSPREGQELSFTGLIGKEDMRLRPEQLDGTGSDEDFEIGSRSDTKLFAVNFETTIGARLRSKTTLSMHSFSDSLDLSGLLRTTVLESPNGNPLSEALFSRGLDVEDKAARQSFSLDWRERHVLGFGFEAHLLDTIWRYRVGDLRSESAPTAKSIGLESLGLPGVSLPDRLVSDVGSVRGGAWMEDRIRWSDRLTLVPGLRLDHSTLNGRTSLSPRFQASYFFRPRTRFRFETSLYHQSPGYEKLFVADRFVDLSSRADGARLADERAFVMSVGLDRELAAGTGFRFDAFYKRYSNLVIGRLETEAERLSRIAEYDFPPELADQIPRSPRLTVHPVSDGRDSSWGFDASVRKSTASRVNGWVSYSFSSANQTAYGRSFPFEYDATHTASFVARLRLSPSMAFSLRGSAARGFPRTPAVAPRVAANRSESGQLAPMRDDFGELVYTPDFGDVSNLNSARKPAFARLDFRFTYHTGGGDGRFV